MSVDAVLDGAGLYRHFRRGESASAFGVELRCMQFESNARGLLLPEDEGLEENTRFAYPLFLPEQGHTFRDVLVILNGLNDSSFRKFVPWAASIARAGMPVIVFPTALLINRRPRGWISPGATQRAFEARLRVAPDTATGNNAVLSARVAARPLCLLHDLLHTAADLRALSDALEGGALVDAHGAQRFAPGTRVHLLGYSLGGYLALALRLIEARFAHAHVIALCAGASASGPEHARLDPVNPYILDRDAAARLLDHIPRLASGPQLPDPDLAAMLLELLTGTRPATRARLHALAAQATLLGATEDRVVPSPGIAANLGRVDQVLPIGHEYPFNLASVHGIDESRAIALSHRVSAEFAPAFREFVAAVLRGLPDDHMYMPPLTASTCPVT